MTTIATRAADSAAGQDLEVLRRQIAFAPDEASAAPRWLFERLEDVREQRRAQVFVIESRASTRRPPR